MLFAVYANEESDKSKISITSDYDRAIYWAKQIKSNQPIYIYEIEPIGDIDIFLDDGSHQVGHQILTFIKVWPHIKNGGVYMCEDTHTSYFLDWGNGLLAGNTYLEFAKKLTDVINKDHWQGFITVESDFLRKNFADIASITFNNSIVTIIKGQPKWIRPNPYPGHDLVNQ